MMTVLYVLLAVVSWFVLSGVLAHVLARPQDDPKWMWLSLFALPVLIPYLLEISEPSEQPSTRKTQGKKRMPNQPVFHKVPTVPVRPISEAVLSDYEYGPQGGLIGWRYFEVADGVLCSVGMGLIDDCYNPVTRRMRSSYADGWNASDVLPTMTNRSGIYAFKARYSSILDGYAAIYSVLGKVELFGEIIEEQYMDGNGRLIPGVHVYRAQFCHVLEVYS
jgi:hypothetical protein